MRRVWRATHTGMIRHAAIAVALGLGLSGCGEDALPPDRLDGLELTFEALAVEGEHVGLTALAFVPGTSPDEPELLLGEKSGRVSHYRIIEDELRLLGSFEIPAHDDLDCGLLSMAFDPGYADNGFLFLGRCTSITHSEVTRVRFTPDQYDRIAASAVAILTLGDDQAIRPWHPIGSIGFDAEGYLWALFGDKVISDNGQDTSNALGSVVRVAPNRDPHGEGATPAPDNPFLDDPAVDDRIWAYGLRSPWTGHMDAKGRLWIGDVGADDFEELNLLTSGGENFGWATSEGPCKLEDCSGVSDPLTHWSHSLETDYVLRDPLVVPARASVGYVALAYSDDGSASDPYGGALDGRVIFGDLCKGWLRLAEANDAGELVVDAYLGHLVGGTDWAEAPDGTIYVTGFEQCESRENKIAKSRLYRAVRKPQ